MLPGSYVLKKTVRGFPCQGLPRSTESTGLPSYPNASVRIEQFRNTYPYWDVASVAPAVRDAWLPRISWIVQLSNTTILRPKMKSTEPSIKQFRRYSLPAPEPPHV